MNLLTVLKNHLLKGRIQKFKETRDSRYTYRNELDKACFQHDMAYGYFKDFARKTDSYKVLTDKTFILLKIKNMMDIKEVLLLWFKNFLIKRLLVEQLNLRQINNLQMNFINQLLEN